MPGLPWIEVEDVGIVVSEYERDESALNHHEVVSAIHERVDCLPIRFPTVVEGESEARELVIARREPLAAALARVRGQSEWAITLAWRELPSAAPPTTGRAYMEQRLARSRRESAARALVDQLELPSQDVQTRLCPSEKVAASVALLLPRGARPPASPELPDVDIVVNGPWPPYSFAMLS